MEFKNLKYILPVVLSLSISKQIIPGVTDKEFLRALQPRISQINATAF